MYLKRKIKCTIVLAVISALLGCEKVFCSVSSNATPRSPAAGQENNAQQRSPTTSTHNFTPLQNANTASPVSGLSKVKRKLDLNAVDDASTSGNKSNVEKYLDMNAYDDASTSGDNSNSTFVSRKEQRSSEGSSYTQMNNSAESHNDNGNSNTVAPSANATGSSASRNSQTVQNLIKLRNILQNKGPLNLEKILVEIKRLEGIPKTNGAMQELKVMIGKEFNDAAENYKDHDFFFVDPFNDAPVTTSSTSAAEENQVEAERIENSQRIKNWEKWYTYKILAYYYTGVHFTEIDIDLIDKNSKHSALDQLSGYTSYKNIIDNGHDFYEEQLKIAQIIFQVLSTNDNIHDLASLIHRLSEPRD